MEPRAEAPIDTCCWPLLPAERQASVCIIEVIPEGAFVTYGLGVSLLKMRTPAAARARVPLTLARGCGVGR